LPEEWSVTRDLSRLWFGLIAAPAAWMVAELAGYIMSSKDCSRGSPAVVGLSALMAVLAAAGLFVALRNLRARESRERFMAFAGVLVSALLLLNIVYFGVPPFLVNACSGGR
jgi:hypothetical protein